MHTSTHTNIVEQILIDKLKLSKDLYNRFMGLSGTKYLKKKDFFVQQGKVCHYLGLVHFHIFAQQKKI